MTDWNVRSPTEEQSLEERTATQLRFLVESGHITPGEQLMSEPQLALRLGVSRPTLRVAISILVADRLLVRRRGVGTFVAAAAPALTGGFERLRGTSETIALGGQKPHVVDLRIRHEPVPERIREQLGVEPDSLALHIDRVFTADGERVMFAEEWIPEKLIGPASRLDELRPEDSLYQCLSDLGLAVRRVAARFVPTIADEVLSARLDAEVGDPLLLLEQRHYADSVPDEVVMFSDNYHHPDRIDVQVIRRG